MMKNVKSNFYNENSFVYIKHSALSMEKIREVASFIKEQINKSKKCVDDMPRIISVADEILKFKQLLDMGAITEAEYEKKKKELLNK